MPIAVTLPQEYPLVLLSATLLCIECFTISFTAVKPRMKAFNADFMKQFEEEHKREMPESAPAAGGWPDAGEGRYSDKLEYKEWVQFNCAMRVHQNYVESLPTSLIVLAVGGLVLPYISMAVGFFNAVTRLVYTVMYMKYGSNSRVLGAVAGSLPMYLLMLVVFVYLLIMGF